MNPPASSTRTSGGVSRREFLQGTAAVIASSLTGAGCRSVEPTSTGPDSILDVAIVGAGVSGLYSGWRLAQANRSANRSPDGVQIFELSDRAGGRLLSVQLPGMSMISELGGMRYKPSQQLVSNLVPQLGLQRVDFPMGDPSKNLFYLRRQRFRAEQWNQPGFRHPYQVEQQYLGKSPDQLLQLIGKRVVNQDGHKWPTTTQAWEELKKVLRYRFDGPYKNRRVADIGFWNLIEDQVSHEGYQLLADGMGYYSDMINWSAAEALPYLIGNLVGEVQYHTIAGGYDRIARQLAEQFQHDGGQIHFSHRLLGFERKMDSQGPVYQLTFHDTRTGKQRRVAARALVLAMPRRSLRLLDQQNFFFDRIKNPERSRHLDSVVDIPSFKLFLGFEKPWWTRRLGLTSGRSITDMPLRQCYYFGTDKRNDHSLLMASYNDARTVDFWSSLAGGPRHESRAEQVAGGSASQRMVATAMKQLAVLHGEKALPKPYVSAFQEWSRDPYGGGYHAWKPATYPWEVMPKLRGAGSEDRVHICGSSFSSHQGWVEGALLEAEKMLQTSFDLARPDWLPKEYYLGW